MNIITENIKSLRTVISKSETSTYDWDIIVPDFKPDVGKIVSADGISQILSKDIMQDRAMISGNVKINILYIPADNHKIIKNIETTQNFNYVMELSGLRQNMLLNVISSVENININILNSRKLHISSDIMFLGNVSAKNELSYISEVEAEDILCKTREISTYKAISETENAVNISEEIEVPMGNPSIDEILKIDIKINNKDIKAIHNKLIVKGELEIITVYNSEIEGDEVQFMCHEIPFAEIFDIQDIDENTICDADFNLKNITYSLKEDGEGEKRIILIELCVFVQNKAYEQIKINSIVDAYSLKYELETEKNSYLFDEIINQSNGQFNIKDSIKLNDIDNILKIINVNTKADVANVSTMDNSIIVRGNIICNILYISSDNFEICSASAIMPFEQIIECRGATEGVICDFKLDIIKCAYNIVSSNELELRVNMDYTAIIKTSVHNDIICNISYDESKPVNNDNKGLSVYFCCGNENLWDIAKKYRTTSDEIMSINSINDECEIVNGMKLLIP